MLQTLRRNTADNRNVYLFFVARLTAGASSCLLVSVQLFNNPVEARITCAIIGSWSVVVIALTWRVDGSRRPISRLTSIDAPTTFRWTMPSEARQIGLPPARASLPSSFRNVGTSLMCLSLDSFFLICPNNRSFCLFVCLLCEGKQEEKFHLLISSNRVINDYAHFFVFEIIFDRLRQS